MALLRYASVLRDAVTSLVRGEVMGGIRRSGLGLGRDTAFIRRQPLARHACITSTGGDCTPSGESMLRNSAAGTIFVSNEYGLWSKRQQIGSRVLGLSSVVSNYSNVATKGVYSSPTFLDHSTRHFSTRNIRGRLFYRRRPKMIPRYKPKNRRSCWLEGCPQKKGVCVTIRVVTPRKPNSGLRKVARVRLSTGRTVTCHVPGEGHNLHTHSVVLVRGGRCQDVSGCHYKVIRGKYDLLPVKNRISSRSKYGVRLTDATIEKRRMKMNRLHVTTDLDREVFNRLMLHDWINPDGTRRTGPVGPEDPVPVDIFTFNSRLRSIVHSSGKD